MKSKLVTVYDANVKADVADDIKTNSSTEE